MFDAFILQLRVIGALILRETRVRFGRTKLGYLWAFIEPSSQIAVLSIVFTVIGRKPDFGISMATFFATGIIPFLLYKNLTNKLSTAFSANQALLTYPVVKELDTLFARALLEMTTMFVIALITFMALIYLGLTALPPHPLDMMGALGGICLLGFGVGSLNAILNSIFKSWKQLEPIITKPLFFISGIFFTLESLPSKFAAILTWNPILHAVEWMRYGVYMNYRGQNLDVAYLLWCGLGTTALALSLERLLRRKRSTSGDV